MFVVRFLCFCPSGVQKKSKEYQASGHWDRQLLFPRMRITLEQLNSWISNPLRGERALFARPLVSFQVSNCAERREIVTKICQNCWIFKWKHVFFHVHMFITSSSEWSHKKTNAVFPLDVSYVKEGYAKNIGWLGIPTKWTLNKEVPKKREEYSTCNASPKYSHHFVEIF